MARPVLDGFAEHYAETFWGLIPEIYRHEDGYADPPGQLRALCEILGAEAAIARRSIDRLQADSRIDEADDWALPYIAQILGTRLTSALNPAARRAVTVVTSHGTVRGPHWQPEARSPAAVSPELA